METIEKTFTPQIIGFNSTKYNEIIKTWEDHLVEFVDIQISIEQFLSVDRIELEDLMNILAGPAETLLVRLHTIKGKIPELMNLEKMVQLGIITNPFTDVVIKHLDIYLKGKQKANHCFPYDISRMNFVPDGWFEPSEEFLSAAKEACTRYTKNQKENDALAGLNSFIQGLNYFVEIGIMRTNFGIAGIGSVTGMIRVNKDCSNFEINPDRFMKNIN